MNQISNPGQQPGQHSAQPVAPHQQQNIRFAPVPYAVAQQYGGYDPRQQQQSYQPNVVYNHATLTLPQNSHIATSTNSNGMTMVDVAAPPFG
uniref:Uncharacterized protein n=1 Tax=Panagrolaimus sp. ES5 TaxID=591445 RepID=A0AC34FHC5_9BILA